MANLEELGFVVQKGEDGRSAAVDVGEVMAVTPGPGDGPVAFGSTVTITVSVGVPLVQVPDVSGMKQDEAPKALEAVGSRPTPRSSSATRCVSSSPPPARPSSRAPR